MITADDAYIRANQVLEDALESRVIESCDSGDFFTEVPKIDLPGWLQKKILERGFNVSEGESSDEYRVSWER